MDTAEYSTEMHIEPPATGTDDEMLVQKFPNFYGVFIKYLSRDELLQIYPRLTKTNKYWE